MKWSWTVGRVAGIELRVHATFLMLLAWLALAGYRTSGSVAEAFTGVLFALALFGSVLLHELGHALAARRVGVPTRNITLLPIGGVAQLGNIPDEPKQELGIALAGPAVTVLIVVILALSLRLAGLPVIAAGDTMTPGTVGTFVANLLWLNILLFLFNMLPAFPMDGGRVLRALLALRMDYVRATGIATRIGYGFALLFGVVGVFYNPYLVLIALFVWISAAAEAAALQQRSALSGIPVSRVMIEDIRMLAPTDTLNAALEHVLAGFQQDFPVVEGSTVVGVLTRAGLLGGLARNGAHATVASAMDTSFGTATPEELVNETLARLRDGQSLTLPVLRDGRLCGLLTADNIAEFVMIDAALHATAHDAPRPRLAVSYP